MGEFSAWLDAQGVSGVDENFSFEHVMVVACPHLAAHTRTIVVGHPNRVALGHHWTPTILAKHLILLGEQSCNQGAIRDEKQPGQRAGFSL